VERSTAATTTTVFASAVSRLKHASCHLEANPNHSPFQQGFQQPSQANFNSPTGQQGQFYNNQSPPYQQLAPSGPMNPSYQHNFRGGQRGYRGNNFNVNMRGGRGEFRGRGGGQFQNLHWNSGRGGHSTSGSATPQQTSPQQQFPPQNPAAPATPQQKPAVEEDDNEDLFRPSKELQVEEKVPVKKADEEKMPPPSKAPPTGPQSSKFSFALKPKITAKSTNTTPKPDISQKLTVAPVRKDVLVSPERARPARPVPTEPASARRQQQQSEFRAPSVLTTRKVKKIMKRPKPRPQLDDDFKKSDSVYYRKPGNESVVGSGTYGKVFKGVHVYTKNLVALKKIRMEGERDGFPVTAVREIKLLQSLKHRNIVKLHEVMVEKNDCFMVFEYLSHDLTGLLNHPTFKLDDAHKKDLAKQLFEGLDYLHRRGVLHRDIKAANILVSADGQMKIADFGLARFYAKRRQLDYTNRVITIWYRSPELLLGETQYGPAVDIWSAACVLVEIFTRHAIFPGDGGEISQLEKIYAVLGTPNRVDWPGLVDMAWFELLRPSAKRANVFAEKYKSRITPAAFELLEAMFQYDPAKRPSASDVLEHPYFTVEAPKPRQVVE
jgi:CTD kinase subunit alpha